MIEKASRKRYILVIEDDEDISKTVAYALEDQGYQVEVIHDGEVGLKAVQQSLPDLVILDLMLPGLSGEEVCKDIRESEFEDVERIPIMMLTAKSMLSDRIVGKVIGANAYVTKPFAMSQLIKEVESLLCVS